ncbi:MAG: hypothetical protein DI604_11110 [Delftia acidovorans]|nr:MAG: hypothetical protein DI604_11110 [Delftia acidovorans]
MAFAGAGVALAPSAEEAHALMHFAGEAHHHDDHEHTPSQDDAVAGSQHAASDAGIFSPALVTFVQGHPQLDASSDYAGALYGKRVNPFVQGLERPPKTFS